jgi:bacterioferritin-associated ferredoxin
VFFYSGKILTEVRSDFMNKAFVREQEPDGRAYCPQCGTLGVAVGKATLDHHIVADSRSKLGDGAWFCGFARCDVAYFDLFERLVLVSELRAPIYPKDTNAPICPCFGFTLEDIESAIQQRSPESIRELLRKSTSKEANCGLCSPDGQCCMQEVQRLYIRGVGAMN